MKRKLRKLIIMQVILIIWQIHLTLKIMVMMYQMCWLFVLAALLL